MSSSLDPHVARLAVERGIASPDQVQEALAIQSRGAAGATAPPPEPFAAAYDVLRGKPLLEVLTVLGRLDARRASELEAEAVVAAAGAAPATPPPPVRGGTADPRATLIQPGFTPAPVAAPPAAAAHGATFFQPGFRPEPLAPSATPAPAAGGTVFQPGFRPAPLAGDPAETAGVLRGKREALLRILRARFGALRPDVEQRLQAIQDPARIDGLLDRFVDARTLADLGI